MSWHVGTETLDGYLADRLDHAYAASVEAHLLACAVCRDELAARSVTGASAKDRHEETWDGILEAVDRVRPTAAERLLRRLGVPLEAARLAAATPALRQAWWLAGCALLAAAVLIAHVGPGTVGSVAFVVTAPVVPLAGVALAYGWRGDPAGEVAVVAPYSTFRLVLLRTLVVLGTWLPVAVLLALVLPIAPTSALLWFLPCMALCASTLALSTFVDPVPVATVLGVAWFAAAAVALRGAHRGPVGDLLEQFVAFRPAGQASLAAVVVVACLVIVARRSAFEVGRTS